VLHVHSCPRGCLKGETPVTLSVATPLCPYGIAYRRASPYVPTVLTTVGSMDSGHDERGSKADVRYVLHIHACPRGCLQGETPVTVSVATPLYPYGIAYRRAYAPLCPYGVAYRRLYGFWPGRSRVQGGCTVRFAYPCVPQGVPERGNSQVLATHFGPILTTFPLPYP
jgi:hypothetical protein